MSVIQQLLWTGREFLCAKCKFWVVGRRVR